MAILRIPGNSRGNFWVIKFPGIPGNSRTGIPGGLGLDSIFSCRLYFWPTVLSVEPLVHYVVCLSVCLSSVVCDVLYCGETVRPSKKLSEGVNKKPGSKR